MCVSVYVRFVEESGCYFFNGHVLKDCTEIIQRTFKLLATMDLDNMSLNELLVVFSVHDFLLGDKEMASPNSPGSALDQVG